MSKPNYPDEVCEAAARITGTSDFDTWEFGCFLMLVKLAEQSGTNLRELIGNPDMSDVVLSHQVPMVFSANPKKSKFWPSLTLSVQALALACSMPCRFAGKEMRGITLATLSGVRRKKEFVRSVTGSAFDDDGVICETESRTELNSDFVVVKYETATSGKNSDLVPVEALEKFAPGRRASNTLAAEYLNRSCAFGPAYRGVELEYLPNGRPLSVVVEGVRVYPTSFHPQVRTRGLVPYAVPLAGDVLSKLNSDSKIYEAFAREAELEIFGANGSDPATLRAAPVAFLPSGHRAGQYFSLSGFKLFDPYPAAHRVIERHAARAPRRPLEVGGELTAHDLRTLKGVMIASLLEDWYPELLLNSSNDPAVLKRCPFAHDHASKRGQADGSAFAYDPDPDKGYAYPTIKCHHQTCKTRPTKDFVEALIANGDLAHDDVFNNPHHRLAIRDRR